MELSELCCGFRTRGTGESDDLASSKDKCSGEWGIGRERAET